MEFNFEEALQNALEYWTPERIAATVPLEDVFPICGSMGGDDDSVPSYHTGGDCTSSDSSDDSKSYYIGGPRQIANYNIPPEVLQDPESFSISEDRENRIRPVTEKESESQPYHSVGKICARKDGSINQDIHVTAFYIGEQTGMEMYTVLTVAHMFEKRLFRRAQQLVFITPSNEIYMIDPSKKQCHPAYRKCSSKLGKCAMVNAKFDLCVLPVYPLGGRHIDRKKCYIYDYTPFELVAEGDIDGKTFNIIGYPFQGNMTLISGRKVSTQKLQNYEHPTIQIDNLAARGTSGGPWIIEGHNNLLVYGIQSSNTLQYPRASNATSPYFREELLKPLDLKYRVERVE